MSDWDGLYVVDIDDGNHVTLTTRYVVIAGSADGAGTIAARAHWPAATDPEAIVGMDRDGRIRVGRLGDHSPGITGARMAPYATVAVQHPIPLPAPSRALVEQDASGTWGLSELGARVVNAASNDGETLRVTDLLHALVNEEVQS